MRARRKADSSGSATESCPSARREAARCWSVEWPGCRATNRTKRRREAGGATSTRGTYRMSHSIFARCGKPTTGSSRMAAKDSGSRGWVPAGQTRRLDGVSVLFCATDRETSEFLLTGWYTNATVHRHPIKRPGRDRLQREVYFTATDATVIPESERCFHLPRKRDKHKFPFGGIGPRTFVWYGLNDDRAAGFCESLHRYMTTRVSTQTPDEVVVESRKRRISERLERQGASRQFIKEKGYRCEACGWSLDEFDEAKQSVWKSSFELHHLTPFSKLEEGGSRTVRSDDFAVLCASCHRAIHRTDHVSDIQAFVQACQPKDRSPRP